MANTPLQTDEREATLEKALRDVLVEAAVQHRHHYKINEPTDMCAVCRAQKALFTVAPQTPASERVIICGWCDKPITDGVAVRVDGEIHHGKCFREDVEYIRLPEGAQPEGPRVTLGQVEATLNDEAQRLFSNHPQGTRDRVQGLVNATIARLLSKCRKSTAAPCDTEPETA